MIKTLRFTSIVFVAVAGLGVACGGGQKPDPTNTGDGDGDDDNTAGDGDQVPGDGDGDGDGTAAGSGDGTAAGDGDGDGSATPGDGDGDGDGSGSGSAAPVPQGPAVTFELLNTHDIDLAFNLDAGWGAVILVYSGVPPKAKSILPFPTQCTAACTAAVKDRCPICNKPTTLGQIRKAQLASRVIIAPAKSLEVTWDGEVHSYTKTTAGNRKCKCFSTAPPPPATYTVRICGLRLSTKHKTQSDFQCLTKEDALTFPSDEPQKLTFDFGDPAPPKKKKTPKTAKKKP